MTDKLVTIIGSSYFESISALLERLEKYGNVSSTGVQAGYYVTSFAPSICLLAVVCLESYVMRVRYINKATTSEIDNLGVPAYLKKLYPDFPLETELFEIHIIRDVIAHNHLWEISFSWDDESEMVLQEINKLSSGDKKYKNESYVDAKNHRTRTLQLNLNPIKIDTSDVKKVLHIMWKVLLFLEMKNRSQCYVSHLNVIYNGKLLKFGNIIGLPETCT
ncbi:MAG: hypothetical protein ACXW1W_13180 [Methylococcaceae bacterium]